MDRILIMQVNVTTPSQCSWITIRKVQSMPSMPNTTNNSTIRSDHAATKSENVNCRKGQHATPTNSHI